MPKKKKNSKLDFYKTRNLTLLVFLTAFAAVGGTLVYSSYAAPGSKIPTGTIELSEESDISYGGFARYDVKISDYNSNKKNVKVFIKQICTQENRAVYNGALYYDESFSSGYDFDLVDTSGQGLDWDPTKEAWCAASLVYQEGPSKNRTISGVAGSGYFTVPAQQ